MASLPASMGWGQEGKPEELEPPWGECGMWGIVPEIARPIVPDQVQL